MSKARRIGIILILLSGSLSILWGIRLAASIPGGALDFQGLYYGTRCLIAGCDPYNLSQLDRELSREGPADPAETPQRHQVKVLYVNVPTTFLFVAPLAVMPWGPAHVIWMALIIAGFMTASVLMWDMGARASPALAALLVCIVLANSEVVFATGNTAGLVVSLSIIAVWCFLHERFAWIGVLCFAAALAIKPHDSGLVWLYFVLAGGSYRKRALQSLAITVLLALAALVWVSHVAPHWMQEIRANLGAISGHGGLNEPGPSSVTGHTAGMVVDLQAAVSIFWDNPTIYNSVSYAICGVLLLFWFLKTLHTRTSPELVWIALAAIAPLTMLVTYHRPYDTKLLMLAVPACCMLWSEGGRHGKIAAILTTAGVALTGDIPLASLIVISKSVLPATSGFVQLLLALILTRPASLILLALTAFYLWVYLRPATRKRAAALGAELPASEATS